MTYTYQYPRPAVTVDCVIFLKEENESKVLLIKRGNYPFEGYWAFPGGFIEMDEKLVDSAKRELEEETGLKNVALEQLHTFGDPGRDPRGRTVAVVFWGVANKENNFVQGGDDAIEAKWFPVSKIPKLAFDHNEIFKIAIQKLND